MKNELDSTEEESRESNQSHSDLRLMELADRNPSLGGRELLREIIERGPEPEDVERPHPRDVHAALSARALDDPDYRTQPEHADWIGRESKLMRDLYERGAEVKGDVLVIPAEEHELSEDRDIPFITSLSYAINEIKDAEKAVEFHSLAHKIGGETADARTQIVVFKTFYDRITRDERGSHIDEESRPKVLSQTLDEMRRIAAEMEKLETRESVEIIRDEEPRMDERGMDFNVASRKVRLDENALRFPAGLAYEVKEQLVGVTFPEIDRRLESGASRAMLFAAIDGGFRRRDENDGRDLTEQERSERLKAADFLKRYIDERLRDPETRALNASAEFRQARAEFIAAKTTEDLGRVAETFLRHNRQRSEELRLHLADPDRHPRPTAAPLDWSQRNLLFNGRAPEHHTREMRELRIHYGLSRADRAARTEKLHQGLLEPSRSLGPMIEELEKRRTGKAVSHFQASLLNDHMNEDGRLNLNLLYKRIPPHERAYLFERSESLKQSLEKTIEPDRQTRQQESLTSRIIGAMPRESASLREYLQSMGRIERHLLNQEVRRFRINVNTNRDRDGLTISEARSLLPEQTSREIRVRARNLAWGQIAPAEAFERNPSQEAMRISDTIAHIQEHLQERARIAQNARNEFVADKVRGAENRLREMNGHDRARSESPARMAKGDRERLVQLALASLSPEDARKLAELDRYVADTREAVYRGFETIDSQRRDLDLVRAQFESPRAENVKTFQRTEPRSLPESSYAALADRVDPLVSTHAVASAGRQERHEVMSGLEREFGETTLSDGHINSDREWHFDSLRDALNQERPGGDDLSREYAEHQNRNETVSRTLDR
jgi:hypothetical protein